MYPVKLAMGKGVKHLANPSRSELQSLFSPPAALMDDKLGNHNDLKPMAATARADPYTHSTPEHSRAPPSA